MSDVTRVAQDIVISAVKWCSSVTCLHSLKEWKCVHKLYYIGLEERVACNKT